MLRLGFARAALLLFPCVFAWGQPPKYKAVWEPVNFKGDLMLCDIYFVSDNVGWAVGGAGELSGGVILHTLDAGANWTIQMGDPQSSDAAIQNLRFIDATHGWAVQDVDREPRLLHTDDGQTWSQAGSIPRHFSDYTFTSLRHGILAHGADLHVTEDGGNSWKQVATCQAQAEVDGLTRRIGCSFHSVSFPTAVTGYVVGSSEDLAKGFVLFKTKDGGATWQSSVVPSDSGVAENVFFIDDNTGYVRIGYPDTGQLYGTLDGGRTWNRIAASPGKTIRFADSEVGWAFHYGKLSYTTSGGKMWNSRTFTFPGRVDAFSLPSRNRAYVAGPHGLVYRYSVVPADYSAKGMIDAPIMPVFDLKIDAEVQKLRPRIQAIKVTIDRAIKAAPTDATQSSHPAVQDCCATEMAGLQTSFTGLTDVFLLSVTRYRGLNLLLEGRNFPRVQATLDGAGEALAALKSAPTLTAAANALQQFSSLLDQIAQSERASPAK